MAIDHVSIYLFFHLTCRIPSRGKNWESIAPFTPNTKVYFMLWQPSERITKDFCIGCFTQYNYQWSSAVRTRRDLASPTCESERDTLVHAAQLKPTRVISNREAARLYGVPDDADVNYVMQRLFPQHDKKRAFVPLLSRDSVEHFSLNIIEKKISDSVTFYLRSIIPI